jgi:hypothetical protein
MLKGDCASVQEVTQVHVAQVQKWMKGNEIWVCVLMEPVREVNSEDDNEHLTQLLSEFQDVFVQPNTLPPSRVFDHHIPLLPGLVLVNTRPCRYAPLHNDEIERKVSKLMKVGLIVPSVSPFASPMFLVQKKDVSWRFCVDYRKLNSMTVKNRFPMPLVDEILDELTGTHFFTSMDMTRGYQQIRMGVEDEFKTTFKPIMAITSLESCNLG